MRKKWKESYRLARIIYRSNPQNTQALCSLRGFDWLAWLIVQYKRDSFDPLLSSPEQNLIALKIVDEVLKEKS